MAWHWLGTVWRQQQDTAMHVWCWCWAIPHRRSWGHCSSPDYGRGASTDYEDLPRMSPPVFSGFAHDGGCIFVPTPGMLTPPLVHVESTMPTSSPTPHKEAVQIEQIPVEDIEPVVGLRRSRRPPRHAPNCGTGDGMYFIYISHLLELLILCIWLNMLI